MWTVKVNGKVIGQIHDERAVDNAVKKILERAQQRYHGMVSIVFEDEKGRPVRIVGFHL